MKRLGWGVVKRAAALGLAKIIGIVVVGTNWIVGTSSVGTGKVG